MSCAGIPMASSTITSVIKPAWGTINLKWDLIDIKILWCLPPAVPIDAQVAVILVIKLFKYFSAITIIVGLTKQQSHFQY